MSKKNAKATKFLYKQKQHVALTNLHRFISIKGNDAFTKAATGLLLGDNSTAIADKRVSKH